MAKFAQRTGSDMSKIAIAALAAGVFSLSTMSIASSDQSRLQLARRVVLAMREGDALGQSIKSGPAVGQAFYKQHPGLTDEQRQVMAQAFAAAHAALVEKLRDRLAEIYAETYSEGELRQLAEFYESPVGRTIAEKRGALAGRYMAAQIELMPAYEADMHRRICLKFDCASPAARKQ